MKVFLLSDPSSIHTIRWAKALSARGVQTIVYGFSSFNKNDYNLSGVAVYTAALRHTGFFNKIKYLTSIGEIKKLIRDFKPDIVHAHYATSYGLLGRLSGFQPLIISVWGSDVFDFPNASPLHRYLFKSNLSAAAKILSTSNIMAKETRKYLPKEKDIEVIPFGIDLKRFNLKDFSYSPGKKIIIGTIKALYRKYGVDFLIEAFHILRTKYPQLSIQLLIVGEGNDENRLRRLVGKLQREDCISFLGRREHTEVPEILKSFDIFAALSIEESFGVAVVEASACGLPVVVSDAGGLPEVVENEVTGIIVPRRNPVKAAEALERLVLNKELRIQMGTAGRKRTEQYYDWNNNVNQMIDVYNRFGPTNNTF